MNRPLTEASGNKYHATEVVEPRLYSGQNSQSNASNKPGSQLKIKGQQRMQAMQGVLPQL